MIPVRRRAAALACEALAELLYAAEILSALVTLWRVNEYGQWPHSFLGRAALWFRSKYIGYLLPTNGPVKPND
jgi:hypothetical protein